MAIESQVLAVARLARRAQARCSSRSGRPSRPSSDGTPTRSRSRPRCSASRCSRGTSGTVGLPVQLALAPFLVLLGWFAYRRAYTRDVFAEHWRWDAVFLVLFVFMLECRYINPSASFAEKFMDHGFVASIMRTPIVPPWDPWYAGGHLNVYYYYGSWIMGVLGLSTGVSSRLVFNLGLPTVLALAGVNCYMVGHLLLDRYRWLPVLPLILPNPASVLLAAQGIPLSKVAWDSTRVITDTINEYPLFSFTWGDLHAHVIGIFNQAFLIALLVLALELLAAPRRSVPAWS